MEMSITTAQTNLENAIDQSYAIQVGLQKHLAQALAALAAKDPGLALMEIMMALSSESAGTIGLAENAVDQDAQKMNIMTALATSTKDITADLNIITSPTSTAAQRATAAGDLVYNQTAFLTTALSSNVLTTASGQPFIDPATGQQVQWMSPAMQTEAQNALNTFMAQTGMGTPGNPGNVVTTIRGWIASPTSGTPTGQQQLATLNSDLAVMSNQFQSLSTAAQNVVKEANTTLTQYQSNESTLFTDYVAAEKAIVSHSAGG